LQTCQYRFRDCFVFNRFEMIIQMCRPVLKISEAGWHTQTVRFSAWEGRGNCMYKWAFFSLWALCSRLSLLLDNGESYTSLEISNLCKSCASGSLHKGISLYNVRHITVIKMIIKTNPFAWLRYQIAYVLLMLHKPYTSLASQSQLPSKKKIRVLRNALNIIWTSVKKCILS